MILYVLLCLQARTEGLLDKQVQNKEYFQKDTRVKGKKQTIHKEKYMDINRYNYITTRDLK